MLIYTRDEKVKFDLHKLAKKVVRDVWKYVKGGSPFFFPNLLF